MEADKIILEFQQERDKLIESIRKEADQKIAALVMKYDSILKSLAQASPPFVSACTKSSTKTEKEKMLAGELYNGMDPQLITERARAREILAEFNATMPYQLELKAKLLKQLLGGTDPSVWIEPPFYVDYGSNIFLGRNVFMNFGCCILDCNRVEIGDQTMFAPYVQVYTAHHPTDIQLRLEGKELATPVKIGRNVWIGGGAIILPGVTIGDNCVIGAGSVVTKSLPANVVAVGNPCKVIKQLK